MLNQDFERCSELLKRSDLRGLRQFSYKVSGPISYEIHRQTRYPKFETAVNSDQFRMPGKAVQNEIFARDGWRCRYCGVRVISKDARNTFRKYFPIEARKGPTNEDNHFGLATLTGSIDHVLPYKRGGTNDMNNLVTACGPCQFGKGHWTLDEIELEDPRNYPPVVDGWDGLSRLKIFRSHA